MPFGLVAGTGLSEEPHSRAPTSSAALAGVIGAAMDRTFANLRDLPDWEQPCSIYTRQAQQRNR